MESVSTAVQLRHELSSSSFLTCLLGVKCLGDTLYSGVIIKEFKLTDVPQEVRRVALCTDTYRPCLCLCPTACKLVSESKPVGCFS
jgi:hypothetical protein